MAWLLGQFLTRVVAIAATLYLVGLVLFDVEAPWRNNRDDPFYAAYYFDDLLAYDRIIASRFWRNLDYLSCKYGVVSLSAEPAAQPAILVQQDTDGLNRDHIWPQPEEWQSTPMAVASADGWDISDFVTYCGKQWPDGEAERVSAALKIAGSFYAVRGTDTLFIYAPTARIAARIQIFAA